MNIILNFCFKNCFFQKSSESKSNTVWLIENKCVINVKLRESVITN